MKKKTLRVLLIAGMALSLSFSISTGTSSAIMPITIDHFIAKVFPEASHYFWVVNDSKKETARETIVDLNTFVTQKEGATPTVENRFLLLIARWAGSSPLKIYPSTRPSSAGRMKKKCKRSADRISDDKKPRSLNEERGFSCPQTEDRPFT